MDPAINIQHETLEMVQEDRHRLQEAGDALADAVSDIMGDDPESVLHTHVRNWRRAVWRRAASA